MSECATRPLSFSATRDPCLESNAATAEVSPLVVHSRDDRAERHRLAPTSIVVMMGIMGWREGERGMEGGRREVRLVRYVTTKARNRTDCMAWARAGQIKACTLGNDDRPRPPADCPAAPRRAAWSRCRDRGRRTQWDPKPPFHSFISIWTGEQKRRRTGRPRTTGASKRGEKYGLGSGPGAGGEQGMDGCMDGWMGGSDLP